MLSHQILNANQTPAVAMAMAEGKTKAKAKQWRFSRHAPKKYRQKNVPKIKQQEWELRMVNLYMEKNEERDMTQTFKSDDGVCSTAKSVYNYVT